MTDNITPALLDTPALSAHTGISEVTLRAWRHRGQGPRWFNLGRKCFYKREDVDAWLTEQYETTETAQYSA